ncbi:hypothetical protein BpHYR1_024074 [Brachionus plicatilis]|uniref:Uncharacterized protein n=1 Tax=Brachionus plicatilis TaxID=10195 RepID=A0A3M7P586_BRAPC|nr:hypothetical protein BpHYR1_024074 [Brachionus plicatilis]
MLIQPFEGLNINEEVGYIFFNLTNEKMCFQMKSVLYVVVQRSNRVKGLIYEIMEKIWKIGTVECERPF